MFFSFSLFLYSLYLTPKRNDGQNNFKVVVKTEAKREKKKNYLVTNSMNTVLRRKESVGQSRKKFNG